MRRMTLAFSLLLCASGAAAGPGPASFSALSSAVSQGSPGTAGAPPMVDVPPRMAPAQKSAPMPARSLRLAEVTGVAPLADLRPAAQGAAERVEAIAAWNQARRKPVQNGFARPLPLPQRVRFTAGLLHGTPARWAGGALLLPPQGGLVWGAEVRVEGSYRLRLHLADVQLPAGSQLWVYGESGSREIAFGTASATAQHDLWTPSVAGPAVRLEVRLSEAGLAGGASPGFTVDQVLELFQLDESGRPQLAPLENDAGNASMRYLQDAACIGTSSFAAIGIAKAATAYLQFVDGGSAFICSGALVATAGGGTPPPYLLTASHCISTQASAASLEAVFDYIDATCNGLAPDLNSLPTVDGSTLLATGSDTTTSDYTLLQLATLPSGRGFLGWTTDALADGTELFRVSHPNGFSQSFSTTNVTVSDQTCEGVPRPDFIYSIPNQGGTFGGSSGSPAIRGDGRVVGQLNGLCGPTALQDAGCDPNNDVVDGAFSVSYPALAPFLNSQTGPSNCVDSDTAICLANTRFEVKAAWQTSTAQGTAHAVRLTDDTAYLWFFDASNVEVVIKVLNACVPSLGNHFWVFAGGLTNQGVTITVTDTSTGKFRTYSNTLGSVFVALQDTSAFACP